MPQGLFANGKPGCRWIQQVTVRCKSPGAWASELIRSQSCSHTSTISGPWQQPVHCAPLYLDQVSHFTDGWAGGTFCDIQMFRIFYPLTCLSGFMSPRFSQQHTHHTLHSWQQSGEYVGTPTLIPDWLFEVVINGCWVEQTYEQERMWEDRKCGRSDVTGCYSQCRLKGGVWVLWWAAGGYQDWERWRKTATSTVTLNPSAWTNKQTDRQTDRLIDKQTDW